MLDRIRTCMQSALNLDASAEDQINEQTTAAEVKGWTSVGHLNLILELEKEFGVRFANEEIIEMGSVRAILERLKAKGAN